MFTNKRNLSTLESAYNILLTTSRNFHDDVIEVSHRVEFNGIEELSVGSSIYKLRPTAQKQICTKLNIPHPYLERCDSDLQSKNLNYWLSSIMNKKLFLRMDGDEIRAVFTTRYRPINNIDVVDKLKDLYPPETPVEFLHHEDVMSLSIVKSGQTFNVLKGDDFSPGISIINSETGHKSLSIGAFVLRLVCTNGLIKQVPTGLSKIRHIVSDFFNKFSLEETIENVLTSSQEIRVDLIAAMQLVYDDTNEVFDKINKRFSISEQEKEAVVWGFSHEVGNSLYHIINAYTKGAQYPVLSEDSRYRLEYTGGLVTGLVRQRNAFIQ